MSYNNYLLNLANISNEIGYSLTYGYGDIAATEINSLKALIAKSEEMIPILEAEACFKEMEELDREERYHNHMMRMLYGMEELESAFEERTTIKTNRLNRRKQNKKNKSRDRIHGRRHSGAHGGVDFRYIDCNPFCNKHRYEDAMFATNGKHRHNADRKASAMSAREHDFFFNPSISEMKIEEKEKRMTEEESHILDNHYAVEDMLSDLKEGKYIFLLSYWNGMGWECSEDATNEFHGILTLEEVKDSILSEQTKHLNLVKTKKETIHDMSGTSFTWKGYYDLEDEEDECGYTKFTFLPIN